MSPNTGVFLGLQTQLFLSGSSQKRQIERLKKGPEIPLGRLVGSLN